MVSDLEINEEMTGADSEWLATPWYAGHNNWHPPRWLTIEGSLGMKYGHSFFWGAGMVTSLVPRDIEPLTILESMLTTTTMFFGLLLNAFVISSLTQAFASMNSKKQLMGKQLGQIKTVLATKGISGAVRARILEYFEFQLTSTAAIDKLALFERMPPTLSAQLALANHRRLVARCALFGDVSNASLVTLLGELHAVVFVPGELVVREGMPLEHIYFLNRGLLQLTQRGQPHGTLGNNDNLGADDYLAACLQESARVSVRTAKAITYCDVMQLDAEATHHVLYVDTTFQDALKERRGRGETGERNFLPPRLRGRSTL